MMQTDKIRAVYFIGAGGIGMSALARYFRTRGLPVAGYDRTATELTHELEAEGIALHYEDNPELIPAAFRDREHTLVVFTPAVPADHRELAYFRRGGFDVHKRAEVLGIITRQLRGLCVAGTHGKTTTTSMLAHLLHESHVGCNAFLGGIAKNYATNCLLDAASPYVVVEADEYDRSFHQLRPWATAITATDPDHLDIYGTAEAYVEGFRHYTSLVQPGGVLLMHTGLDWQDECAEGVTKYTYGRDAGDFHAERLHIGDGRISFDLHSPLGDIEGVELGVPVGVNVENGIAAMALAQVAGAEAAEIRAAMKSFEGVVRRFDFKLNTPRIVFLSDYAHHPVEISHSIRSLREVFTGRRITAIFQPHLYTRTRDFYREFAESLSLLDEVILTDIYPAREEPIEGVTSRIIYDALRAGVKRSLCRLADVPRIVEEGDFDVLMLLGAGDLDDMAPRLTDVLRRKYLA